MASGVVFEEIECKSIVTKTNIPGSGLSWSINPYRGCQHACVYCFARGTHEYLGYDSGRDFESRIVVKMNAATVLAEQLRRPGWRKEVIALGTACDPYQQAELKYGVTRSLLKVMLQYEQPVHMLTKSPSVLRDIELWSRLAQVTDARVAFSVPTLDDVIQTKLEPGTSKPIKRLEALGKLVEAGVPCGVLMAPIVPGVTDDDVHLEEVIQAAKEHGASFVAPNILNLKPGSKEWFMPALREAYPHLTPRYEKYYRGPYAPKEYTTRVLERVAELREKWGMSGSRMEPASFRGQLQLGI